MADSPRAGRTLHRARQPSTPSSFRRVRDQLARGSIPRLESLRAVRIFGTLILSTDFPAGASEPLSRPLAPGVPGYHVPHGLSQAMRLAPPPLGHRDVASTVVQPLALVLNPDAVHQALHIIADGRKDKRQHSFLPVVLAEKLGVPVMRVLQAMEGGASAHLVVWAGDPAAVASEILPSGGHGGRAPSWLSPEDRKLFCSVAGEPEELFAPPQEAWAAAPPPQVEASLRPSAQETSTSAAEADGAAPGGAAGASAAADAAAAQGRSAGEASDELTGQDGVAPRAEEPCQGHTLAGQLAGGPGPTKKRLGEPAPAAEADPGAAAEALGLKTPPESARAARSGSASPTTPASPAPRDLVPASWRHLLSPSVLSHPIVSEFLTAPWSGSTSRHERAALRKSASLLMPGRLLSTLPQPVEFRPAVQRPGLGLPRAASGHQATAAARQAATERLRAQEFKFPAGTEAPAVRLVRPFAVQAGGDDAVRGGLASKFAGAMSQDRVRNWMQGGNTTADVFVVDAADEDETQTSLPSDDDTDDLDNSGLPEDGVDAREAEAGLGACCMGRGEQRSEARSVADEGKSGQQQGAAGSTHDTRGAPRGASAGAAAVDESLLRCHVTQLPRFGVVPGLISYRAAARALALEPTPLSTRQLFFTLAGVQPSHDRGGKLLRAFGTDTDSPGGAALLLYPNLALASLPQHLTWVVPAGSIVDQEGALLYTQTRVAAKESLLMKRMRPAGFRAMDGAAAREPCQVNILDEICFFICGSGAPAEEASDEPSTE